jgi:hypothetical protein
VSGMISKINLVFDADVNAAKTRIEELKSSLG